MKVEISVLGADAPLAGFEDYQRMSIGQKTYEFVRRCMRDPELRAKIEAEAARMGAEGGGESL